MIKKPLSQRKTRLNARGFTLVELMISVLLLGVFSTLIYGMFASSSAALQEADTLVDTINQAQFALQHLRTDLQAAASQGSPDSLTDPWVQPKDAAFLHRVLGVMPYGTPGGTHFWQNEQPFDTDILAENPDASFDGIIIMGAIDIPQSLTAMGVVVEPTVTRVHLRNDARGIHRLVVSDPFHISLDPPFTGFDPTDTDHQKLFMPEIPDRLMRITDRQGFTQFGTSHTTPMMETYNGDPIIRIYLDERVVRGANNVYGLDPRDTENSDMYDAVEYDAAFIDAYWYHVVEDPVNPRNFMLVRDRLNATSLVGAIDNINTPVDLSGIDPSAHISSLGNARVVVAENIVDFQIWFSCTTTTTGELSAVAWQENWTESTGGSCMSAAAAEPALARMAHIRLSMRTPNERPDRQHATDGARGGFESTATDSPMQSFDIQTNSPGAARVVTVQTTVELPVFNMRNIR